MCLCLLYTGELRFSITKVLKYSKKGKKIKLLGVRFLLSVDEWIELLESGHRFKIYVWCRPDVAKVLNISLSRRIHGNALCSYIKSSPEGLKSCMRCRACADKLAQRRGMSAAFCINGMFEVFCPVKLKNEWAATVYVSNLCPDMREAQKRIARACEKYSLSYDYAAALTENAESGLDLKAFENTAAAVAEIIAARFRSVGTASPAVSEPVKRLKGIAADFYSRETLKSFSAKYGINEKYLGRLFKESTGLGFSDYRNKMRLGEAAYILGNSDMKIIDIALCVGYDSVSYFAKKFRSEYGLSPSEYRRMTKAEGRRL